MQINILKGTIFALGACFIWGLIFVIPLFMEGFTPIEIAIGRYGTYGTISLIFLAKFFLSGKCRYSWYFWFKAILFSLVCSIGYYTFLILSLRYATPSISALILGTTPITIAFYGNWKKKECRYRSLILPSILIICGLAVINVPHILLSPSPSTFIFGLLCALWALVAWSWYVVANSAFLKENPDVDSGEWSTLIGVGTLFWVLVMSLIVFIFFEDQISVEKYFTPGPQLVNFLLGSAVLGIICSWLGSFLWNKASLYLPVSLAGQLTIFETFFGLCFIYVLEQHLPPMMEFLGLGLIVTAIVYGIRSSTQTLRNQEFN